MGGDVHEVVSEDLLTKWYTQTDRDDTQACQIIVVNSIHILKNVCVYSNPLSPPTPSSAQYNTTQPPTALYTTPLRHGKSLVHKHSTNRRTTKTTLTKRGSLPQERETNMGGKGMQDQHRLECLIRSASGSNTIAGIAAS